MRLRSLLATLLCLAAVPAWCAGPAAARRQAESSLIVEGTATISSDGRVNGYTLRERDRLPKGIVDFIDGALPLWTFQPATLPGDATEAATRMQLVFVAKRRDDGRTDIAIRHAQFLGTATDCCPRLDKSDWRPPRVPFQAQDLALSATVFVIALVGRDGKPIHTAIEQVNLQVVGSDAEMTQWRGLFARASLTAAETWRYIVPTGGEEAARQEWIARIPIVYELLEDEDDGQRHAYGRWQTYVPGPRTRPAWAERDAWTRTPPDALPRNTLSTAHGSRQLLTPLAAD